MPETKRINVQMTPDLFARLQARKAATGISYAALVKAALTVFLEYPAYRAVKVGGLLVFVPVGEDHE